MAAEPAEPLAPAAVQQSTQSGGPVRVPQCAKKGWTARLRATRRRSLAEVPATHSACVGRGCQYQGAGSPQLVVNPIAAATAAATGGSPQQPRRESIPSSWRPQAQRRYQPGVRLVRCAHPLEAPPQQARAGRAGRWPPSARRCQSCQHSTTGKASKVWCAMTVWNYFLAGASFVLKQRLLVAA